MTSPLDIKNTDIKIEVSEFQGKKRVDIRKWYQDKNSGEYKRTQKGLNITTEEWESFLNQIEDIKSFVKENL